MKIDPTCDVRNDCNATQSPVRLHHVTMPTERLLQVIERQLGDLVPQADPRVLAVIATSLVGGVVCGSLIGWFLRSIKCFGRAWLLGSSLTMLRSQPAAIENRAAVGWLRLAGSDLVGAEA
jgi:hypothetical protein